MTDVLEKNDAVKVYEIGYLIISSVPMEKVTDVVTSLRNVLVEKGALMIGEEAPEIRQLAYTMVKKIGSANHKFDRAYFGWVKFELSAGEIEAVKKTFEMHPDVLRMLLITTIKENTYLGKKATSVAVLGVSTEGILADVSTDVPANETLPIPGIEEKPVVTSASIEEMDKSIDEMVKGA